MIMNIFWVSLITIVSLGSLFALHLLIVGIVPGISADPQPVAVLNLQEKTSAASGSELRQDVSFKVDGTTLKAWLYLPQKSAAPVPCIVMAHGFGGTKDMRLALYAQRYHAAGYAVLVFDYRYFGASDGEPRQLIWIPDQLEDWAAAVEFARSREEIDSDKIALWGTSMSGGHVVVTAARDHKIACVSTQCPGLDGRATALIAFKRHGIGHGLKMLVHGQRDLVRSWLGLSPHKIPIFGKPGTVACLATPDAYGAAQKLAQPGFINEVCARINIRGDKYRPVNDAGNVHCPVLLQICDNDALVPPSTTKEAVERLGQFATMIHYPIGHFDIYFGDNFEKAVSDQMVFFNQHLL